MKAVLLIILAFVAGWCVFPKQMKINEWKAFIYPDRYNLYSHEIIGNYPSLEECRAASRAYLQAIGSRTKGDYECGLNCKASGYTDAMICQKTEE